MIAVGAAVATENTLSVKDSKGSLMGLGLMKKPWHISYFFMCIVSLLLIAGGFDELYILIMNNSSHDVFLREREGILYFK